ncbi:hypothetical protein PoB_006607500 [Plakobranchus ocellatus]|uniref:Uncharacterized protein n=1 Tax=Plakobranchus ocellatus TaxID=259542 RepID=A0AAV4D6F8_9GAST|nr:hypothetical protein PoB_006607500 [Plakobranchus ocellatus]
MAVVDHWRHAIISQGREESPVLSPFRGTLVAQLIANPPGDLQEPFSRGFKSRYRRPGLMEGLISLFWAIHNKVISGFRALLQARVPVAGLDPRDRRIPADLRADSLAE